MRDPEVVPPEHLTEASKAFWTTIVADYRLQRDEAGLQLLTLACEALDRCEEARAAVSKDGVTVTSRLGEVKAHPAVAIERDSRLAAVRILRDLGLSPEDAAADKNRPAKVASRQR